MGGRAIKIGGFSISALLSLFCSKTIKRRDFYDIVSSARDFLSLLFFALKKSSVLLQQQRAGWDLYRGERGLYVNQSNRPPRSGQACHGRCRPHSPIQRAVWSSSFPPSIFPPPPLFSVFSFPAAAHLGLATLSSVRYTGCLTKTCPKFRFLW